jgi:hypothetical protein
MIKRSNETSDDFRQTNQCAREGENFIGSLFKTANYGSPRVYGIVNNSGTFSFKAIKEQDAVFDADRNFSGFVVFEKVSVDNRLSIKAVYKQNVHSDTYDKDQGVYYFKSASIDVPSALYSNFDPEQNIPITTLVGSVLNDASPIFSTDACSALIESGDKFSAASVLTPFKITKRQDVKGQDVFMLTLDDYIFTNFADSQPSEKIFTRLFVRSTNEATKL